MDLVSKDEFIDDVSNIKGFSKILQGWVNFIYYKKFYIIYTYLKKNTIKIKINI